MDCHVASSQNVSPKNIEQSGKSIAIWRDTHASLYIHGHSAGGTNPSLVEAMHFGKAVLAFDCNYNRSTTEGKALFFNDSESLRGLVESQDKSVADKVGRDMLEITKRRYTWNIVAQQYFELLGE